MALNASLKVVCISSIAYAVFQIGSSSNTMAIVGNFRLSMVPSCSFHRDYGPELRYGELVTAKNREDWEGFDCIVIMTIAYYYSSIFKCELRVENYDVLIGYKKKN